MYTKDDIIGCLKHIGINPTDTLLVHSSMKAIGQVENGADTVLDAFIEYLHDGLLIFPTHTWKTIGESYPTYDVRTEPSCVGILTNLFLRREGVIRSLHPTHSVAAIGRDAKIYTSGEEKLDTPCARHGCWGKLYDRRAKILFVGCELTRNTFIHGVEEWNNVPNRLATEYQRLTIIDHDGNSIDRPMYRHHCPGIDISEHYGKLEAAFLHKGIARKGLIGDAVSTLCDAVGMADLTSGFLTKNPDLFINDDPVPQEWYIS